MLLYGIPDVPAINFPNYKRVDTKSIDYLMQKFGYDKDDIKKIHHSRWSTTANPARTANRVFHLMIRFILGPRFHHGGRPSHHKHVYDVKGVFTEIDRMDNLGKLESLLDEVKLKYKAKYPQTDLSELDITVEQDTPGSTIKYSHTKRKRVPTDPKSAEAVKRVLFREEPILKGLVRQLEVARLDDDSLFDPRVYLLAASNSYEKNPATTIGSYRLYRHVPDVGVVYYDSLANRLVVAFTGSTDALDAMKNAVAIGAWRTSNVAEINKARNLLMDAVYDFPRAPVALTGHSSGGFLASELGRERSIGSREPPYRLESVVLFNPALPIRYKLKTGEIQYVTENDFGNNILNIGVNKENTIIVTGGGGNHEIENFLKASGGLESLSRQVEDDYGIAPQIYDDMVSQIRLDEKLVAQIIADADPAKVKEMLNRLGVNKVSDLNESQARFLVGDSGVIDDEDPPIPTPPPTKESYTYGDDVPDATIMEPPDAVDQSEPSVVAQDVTPKSLPVSPDPSLNDDNAKLDVQPTVRPIGTRGYGTGVLTEEIHPLFRRAVRGLFTRYNLSFSSYLARNGVVAAKSTLTEVLGSETLSLDAVQSVITSIRRAYGPIIGVSDDLDLGGIEVIELFKVLVTLLYRYRELSRSKKTPAQLTSTSTDEEIISAARGGLIIAPNANAPNADVLKSIKAMLPQTSGSTTKPKLTNVKPIIGPEQITLKPVFKQLKFVSAPMAKSIQSLPVRDLYNFRFN